MASQRNPYAILNVAPDAETVVIEAAYRALMKKYHPDQGTAGEAGPRAAEINAAFAVLRDPQRRADYDHREWTRSQAIQLAQYQQSLPPPPRRSNFFGWGGWLVALVLAGALGIVAGHDSVVPPVVKVEPVKATALPETDLGSQPPIKPVPPAEIAQVRADAMLGPKERAAETAPSPEPLPTPASRPVRTHLALRHRAAPAARAPDKDFVERHGGIY